MSIQEEIAKQHFANAGEAEKLGLAWCKLNLGEWDEEILGPFPDCPDRGFIFRNAQEGIEKIIGEAKVSECWFVFVLGKTKEEWLQWYTTGRFRYEDFKPIYYRRKEPTRKIIVATAISVVTAIGLVVLQLLLGA